MYVFLADLIVVIHLAFVAFVLCGGLLALRWRRLAWLHLPAAVWGAVVEFAGWICPLTPLEHWLRVQGGETVYNSDFITQYVLPALYPGNLTRELQFLFGTIVIALNTIVYGWLWRMQIHGTSRFR